MLRYVLDTSALLTYIEAEDGATTIEALFFESLEDKAELFMSVMSYIEVFYISWREQGATVALERLALMHSLPIHPDVLDHWSKSLEKSKLVKECH
jgi:predicted nucleic acid-binding protein